MREATFSHAKQTSEYFLKTVKSANREEQEVCVDKFLLWFGWVINQKSEQRRHQGEDLSAASEDKDRSYVETASSVSVDFCYH